MASSLKRHGYYGMIVKEWWLTRGLLGIEGSAMSIIKDKIVNCGVDLHMWGSLKIRPDVDEIKRLQAVMENINKCEPSEETSKIFGS